MSKDFDAIKSKISNLLDLSTSDNENEAALAIKKANQLLAKHNLTMGDIQDQDTSMEEKKAIGSSWKWERYLADAVAQYNFCSLFYRGADYAVVFVGSADNVQATILMWNKLRKWINAQARLSGEHINSFCLGAAKSLYGRIVLMVEDRKNSELAEQQALVVVTDQAQEYVDNKPDMQTMQTKIDKVHGAGYHKGVDAASRAPIFDEVKGDIK